MIRKTAVVKWCRQEAVLCVAVLCALLSMPAVPPDVDYLGYVDLRVLCMLFCLMAVVQGFQYCGAFGVLAQRLLSGRRQLRLLMLGLVLLPFFSSMLVTNDVSLITFVPFTVLVLGLLGRQDLLAWTVVLQTLAANLGSMATPVGNPQNLFLYSRYGLSPGAFFSAVLPPALLSFLGLAAAALFTGHETIEVKFCAQARLSHPRLLFVYLVLFLLCLLSVFRVLHYAALTALVLLCLLAFSKKLLFRVDYGLLFTFVCFFVFAGNMGRIPAVRNFLTGLMKSSALISSVLTSQLISNVPAAVLLSGFTGQWRALLLGVNLGGLGTPIASLASLISLKLYLKTPDARPLRYLALFTLANVAGLCLLLIPVLVFGLA